MTLKCRLLFVENLPEVKTIISDLYLELARDIQLAQKQSDLEVLCYMKKKACGFIRQVQVARQHLHELISQQECSQF